MARYYTAEKILNDVAVECGLMPVVDPWTSTDPSFIQLRYLMNSAGEDLVAAHEWQILNESHTIVLDSATYPDGSYPLPVDFAYMIDQTHWDRDANLPLQGPLSPQQWTYLEGRDLATGTIYASFRRSQGEIKFYPAESLSDGKTITFEYIRRTWVQYGPIPQETFADSVQNAIDLILYEPVVFKKFLKLKFLGAKGFDTTAAVQEFTVAMDAYTGRDAGSPILNAARGNRRYPFLNVWRNVPDTGYGH